MTAVTTLFLISSSKFPIPLLDVCASILFMVCNTDHSATSLRRQRQSDPEVNFRKAVALTSSSDSPRLSVSRFKATSRFAVTTQTASKMSAQSASNSTAASKNNYWHSQPSFPSLSHIFSILIICLCSPVQAPGGNSHHFGRQLAGSAPRRVTTRTCDASASTSQQQDYRREACISYVDLLCQCQSHIVVSADQQLRNYLKELIDQGIVEKQASAASPKHRISDSV